MHHAPPLTEAVAWLGAVAPDEMQRLQPVDVG